MADSFFLKRLILSEMAVNSIVKLYRYIKDGRKDYVNELPYKYYYRFDGFIRDKKDDYPELKNIKNPLYFNLEDLEVLRKNNPKIFDIFAEYLLDKVDSGDIGNPLLPLWAIFDYPEILKNTWLIHFTDSKNISQIMANGFDGGITNYDVLSYTDWASDKHRGGKDSFFYAFDVNDVKKLKSYNGKYGDSAVMFRASGVKAYHNGDEEFQVIFQGDTVSNIVPIFRDYDNWVIMTKDSRYVAENEHLTKIIEWVEKNYPQYRKNFDFKKNYK
jgi:hypothetical protein